MKYAIALILISLTTTANAEVTAAVGVDLVHDRGHPYAEIRYFGEDWEHWSVWLGTDRSVGAELYTTADWLGLPKLQLGLGVENAKGGNHIVSTPWAYQIRFEYEINEKWDVGLKHRSNCKKICNNSVLDWIPHGEAEDWNHGYNFLYLRHRF